MAPVAAVAVEALVDPSASVARCAGTGTGTSIARPRRTLLTAVCARRLPDGSTAHTHKSSNGTTFEAVSRSGFNPPTPSNALSTGLHLPPGRWALQRAPPRRRTGTRTSRRSARSGSAGPTRSARHRTPSGDAADVDQGKTVRTVKEGDLGKRLPQGCRVLGKGG